MLWNLVTSSADRTPQQQRQSIEQFCLMLPGKVLDLSQLLTAKKFHNRGNKQGALTAFKTLETDELGNLEEKEKSNIIVCK